MRLNEIPNYDGSIWAYAQMAKYAREMHGPEIGLSVVTAIIGAGAALLINIAAKKRKSKQQGKKSAVSAKSQSKRLI